ncbi:hypothetical protein QOZ80_2BG0188860 [Eleusine coracana subsp. coracana]|nr:hypothetical protein QOZ80_2BG0188860 [Eleusine coracana subsp. coracana]
MGAEIMCTAARRSCSFLLISVMLCFQLLLHQSQAFKLRVGYGEEEKVPLAVIVPDPTPQLSSPAPLAAQPPLSGGGDDDMRPKLPTERWRRGTHHGEARRATAHAPAAAASEAPAPTTTAVALSSPSPAPAQAEAPAPESGGGAALIKSSPAVPVPRGVTDTATILPMPAPGEKRQVGAATSVGDGMLLPLLMLGFAMMASFGL